MFWIRGCLFFLFYLEIKWLSAISGALLMLAVLISWLTPGIFILFGRPWFAHAWLRGINPFAYSAISWDHVSSGVKVAVFIQSIIMSIATLAFLYVSLMNTLNK